MNIRIVVAALVISTGAVRASQEVKHSKEQEVNNNNKLGEQMIEAAQMGDCKKLDALLKEDKTLLEYQDSGSRSPLWWASAKGKLNAVELLLDNNASPDVVSKKDNSPLQIALNNGHKETSTLLLARGSNNQPKDKNKLLNKTIQKGHVSTVALLLMCGASVNTKVIGYAPLHQALESGQNSVTSFLLEKGANVDAPTGYDTQETPLIIATKVGNLEGIRLLLKKGANLNCVDKKINTAVDWAAHYGNYNAVKLLLDGQTETNYFKYTFFINALQDALVGKNEDSSPDIVQLFVGKYGVSPNRCAFAISSKTDDLNSTKVTKNHLAAFKHMVDHGLGAEFVLSRGILYASPGLVALALTQDINLNVIFNTMEKIMKNIHLKNNAIIFKLLSEYYCSNHDDYKADCCELAEKSLLFGSDVNSIVLQYFSGAYAPQKVITKEKTIEECAAEALKEFGLQSQQSTIIEQYLMTAEQKKEAEEKAKEHKVRIEQEALVSSMFAQAKPAIRRHESKSLSEIIQNNAAILTAKDKQGYWNGRYSDCKSYTLLQHVVLWNRQELVELVLETMKANLKPEEMEKVLQHKLEESKHSKGFTAYDLAKDKVKNPYIIAALKPYYEKANTQLSSSSQS